MKILLMALVVAGLVGTVIPTQAGQGGEEDPAGESECDAAQPGYEYCIIKEKRSTQEVEWMP